MKTYQRLMMEAWRQRKKDWSVTFEQRSPSPPTIPLLSEVDKIFEKMTILKGLRLMFVRHIVTQLDKMAGVSNG